MKLAVLDDPMPDQIQEVVRRLVAWNLTVVPPEDHRRLMIVAEADDELVGGLVGHTHWNWLFVSHLWVAEASEAMDSALA